MNATTTTIVFWLNVATHDALVMLGCGVVGAILCVTCCFARDHFGIPTSKQQSKHHRMLAVDLGYWVPVILVALYFLCTLPAGASAVLPVVPATTSPVPQNMMPSQYNAVPSQYRDPCIPGAMVMRGIPLTDQQKQAEEAACRR